jgi:hypothetical protein
MFAAGAIFVMGLVPAGCSGGGGDTAATTRSPSTALAPATQAQMKAIQSNPQLPPQAKASMMNAAAAQQQPQQPQQ